MLAILRFCAGIGLGGELSLADTYVSEILPRQVRGRYMAVAYTLSFFGVPLAAFIGATFVANHDLLFAGWRWLLIVGSLGALVVWALRRNLPESPRWHEIRGELVGGLFHGNYPGGTGLTAGAVFGRSAGAHAAAHAVARGGEAAAWRRPPAAVAATAAAAVGR